MSTIIAPFNGAQINIDAPYLTCAEYGRRVGLTEAAVKQMVQRGQLPVMRRQEPGKRQRTFINVALLAKQALEQKW